MDELLELDILLLIYLGVGYVLASVYIFQYQFQLLLNIYCKLALNTFPGFPRHSILWLQLKRVMYFLGDEG